MQDNNEIEEIKILKREIAKLKLEGNLRKSSFHMYIHMTESQNG